MRDEPESLYDLVWRVHRGDGAAFDVLVNWLQIKVSKLLRKHDLFQMWNEREDLARTAAVELLRYITTFRQGPQAYNLFVNKTVGSVCFRAVKAATWSSLDVTIALPDGDYFTLADTLPDKPIYNPLDTIMRADTVDWLNTCLEKMTPACRRILMALYHEKDYTDETLGTPIHRKRCRQHFLKQLLSESGASSTTVSVERREAVLGPLSNPRRLAFDLWWDHSLSYLQIGNRMGLTAVHAKHLFFDACALLFRDEWELR